jgi:hypothetical protein
MPSRKDELAERRFTKLVDQIKAMMPARLKPGYRGFYAQLVLTRDAVTELGDAAEVRRAARTAGSRLGWKVRTHLADDEMLVIIDDRDPPKRSASWQPAVPPRPAAVTCPIGSASPSPTGCNTIRPQAGWLAAAPGCDAWSAWRAWTRFSAGAVPGPRWPFIAAASSSVSPLVHRRANIQAVAARWLLAHVRSAVKFELTTQARAPDSRAERANKWHIVPMVKNAWLLGGYSRVRDTARHASTQTDTTTRIIPATTVQNSTP